MENLKNREISLKRAEQLSSRVQDYLEAREKIQKGFELKEVFAGQKRKIMDLFGATEDNWQDWHWQIKNRIRDAETISKILNLTDEEESSIEEIGKKYRWAISPYYASLMDENDKYCPVRMMAVPSGAEIVDESGDEDPMAEECTNPAGSITRRYPDRLIINVTNVCPMFCRHCQRRRNIGENDQAQPWEKIQESLDYIASNREIRDVLITGGDPFTLPDDQIERILQGLKAIPHVEYVRIGSRAPVTMPQRVTDQLCSMLAKYHPLFVNVHFNHPKEITEETRAACEKMSNAGIPLGNQAVLLNGINNDRHVMKLLNHELLKIRVRPYYIFHAKAVRGTGHFRTSIKDGIEIMEYLRGYTSGMAIPQFIVNAPGGKGKTPMMPTYILSWGKDHVLIRNWEGEAMEYPDQDTENIYDIY